MTDDLPDWLRAQLDEDERIARAASPGPWEQSGIGEHGWGVSFGRAGAGVEAEDSDQGRADATHIAEHDPARVLREIDAKRAVLKMYVNATGWVERATELNVKSDNSKAAAVAYLDALKALALPYSDRPGFKESWRP
ncbi:DUF6221 family protein [Streptomyces prasinus]|uniref:DUF6221 family protein n=1 Tax=Streptomyces prasinus TaxID=67345 RepID=UPI0033278E5E